MLCVTPVMRVRVGRAGDGVKESSVLGRDVIVI